ALFEPIAAATFRHVVKGRVIVAVDVSESMATVGPSSPPRREVARRLLDPDARDAPIARIARTHAVDAFTFARATTPATLAGLADSLKQPTRPDDPGTQTTDWQPVLAEALKGSDAGTEDAPVLGVVLLTDGRQNGPNDPGPTVDRLAARGIPV